MRHLLLPLFLLLSHFVWSQNLHFTTEPQLISATAQSMTFQWATNTPYTEGRLKWGLSPNDLTEIRAIGAGEPSLTLENLMPSTVYYCQFEVKDLASTYTTDIKPFITSSTSSGEMKVFFNFPVDDSFSNGSAPETNSPTALEDQMIQYILSATKTLDICMYNINRKGYVNALKQIAADGVRVRYIAEGSQSNFSLNTNLNFGLLYAETNGIMHNKWLIIDKEIEDKALVVMGAYNFTKSNLFEGYNNMISIQDKSLAEIYTMEFEEMWGGPYDQPDESKSKMGNKKIDNTPHILFINGTKVESYFSPSDQTTQHMVDALKTTDNDLKFGLLVFTHDDLEDVIFDMEAPVQGLIESQYNGTATNQFQAANIPVYDFDEKDRFLHHKYAIIDANSDSDPTVITGSHNWSYSAEYKNDENTLIIHDADIANIFLQEFMARWQTIVAIDDIDNEPVISISPNPVQNYFVLKNNRDVHQTVSIFDCYGGQLEQWSLQPKEHKTVDIQHFPQGVYQLVLVSKSGHIQSKSIIVLPE